MEQFVRLSVVFLMLVGGIGMADAKKPFERGSTRLSVGGAGNQNGVGMAFGVGHYVADGLELGLDSAVWFADQGNQLHLMPGIRYVVHKPKGFKPYFGAFFHRALFSSEDQDNANSIGLRAGGFIRGGKHFFGIGIAYEKYLDCEGKGCEEFYPEFNFALHL